MATRVQEPRTSPFFRSRLYLDSGELVPGKETSFLGDYPHIHFDPGVQNHAHECRQGDTLEHLATVYFNNPNLWWVLADYQPTDELPIFNPMQPLEGGRRLWIPPPTLLQGIL